MIKFIKNFNIFFIISGYRIFEIINSKYVVIKFLDVIVIDFAVA